MKITCFYQTMHSTPQYYIIDTTQTKQLTFIIGQLYK